MTEFERRQLIANRNELDRAHAEQTAPAVNGKRHRIPNSFIQEESELTPVNSLPAASKGVGRPRDDYGPARRGVMSRCGLPICRQISTGTRRRI
jgi:hypothetical protein